MTYDSLRQFAKALGRNHKSVAKWLLKPSFPCPTAPPWDDQHVTTVKDWALENLRPDRFYRRPTPTDGAPRHVSQWQYPAIALETPEIVQAANQPGGLVASALIFPDPITFPIERAILSGERVMGPAEARAYVLAIVQSRYLSFISRTDEGGQFEGRSGWELRCRLKHTAHEDAERIRNDLEAIFGTDAAGQRPDWLEWKRRNSYAIESDGRIIPGGPFDPDDDENDVLKDIKAFDRNRAPKAKAGGHR